jgi:hypothetical protein
MSPSGAGDDPGFERRSINEPTRRYVTDRVAANVRAAFFRSLGVPGTTLIGIGVFVATQFPAILRQTLDLPVIDNEIKASVGDFLASDAGRAVVRRRIGRMFYEDAETRERLTRVVRTFLADPAGGARWITTEVESAARPHVERVVREHLADPSARAEMRARLADRAAAFVDSTEGRSRLEEIVVAQLDATALARRVEPLAERAVQLAAHRTQGRIREATGALIERFAHELEPEVLVRKGSGAELESFLRRADEIKAAGRPIALTLRFGGRYAMPMIREHREALATTFGDTFHSVVIFDANNRFVALFSPAVLAAFEQRPDAGDIVQWLGAERDARDDTAQARLHEWFGPGSTAVIEQSWSIEDALRQPGVWQDPARLDEEHALVDDERRLIGTVTRRRLIAELLAEPAPTAR